MAEPLLTYKMADVQSMSVEQKHQALSGLESGQVIFFPSCSFLTKTPIAEGLLSETILDGKHKNISFDNRCQKLGGFSTGHANAALPDLLKTFMQAYAQYAKQIVDTVLPAYSQALLWGRTSYRPAEIMGRAKSLRKDDTRLHVDAFAASPVYGQRILRVFCNINPDDMPRAWHLGEAFEDVLSKFAGKIPPYNPVIARLLHWIKATKSLRSAYDHYQLHLHDSMKMDEHYQQSVPKFRFDFPAQSTWVVFTDQVSHAALSGQYLLEQTFYLPVSAMNNPALSPLKCWEREKSAVLV